MFEVNYNYLLGFFIVIIIVYIAARLLEKLIQKSKDFTSDDVNDLRITVITNKGTLKLNQDMMTHYLNRLKENMEYLNKIVDPQKCEKIRIELEKAKRKLKIQVEKNSVSSVYEDINYERIRLRRRVNTLSDVLFENDQNKDDAKSIILEMILDLETLLYLIKVIPHEIDSIDSRDVDNIINLIYKNACYKNEDNLNKIEENQEFINSEESFNSLSESLPKNINNFGTFVDFSKHQDLLGNTFSRLQNLPKLKDINKNLYNMKTVGLSSFNPKKEKLQTSSPRKYKIFKSIESRDFVKDKIVKARNSYENLNNKNPSKRYLLNDYDSIEEETILSNSFNG